MHEISKRRKIFYLILLSLLVGGSLTFYVINKKPTFELKDNRLLDNYYISKEDNTYTGKLYEQDILFSGKVTSEIAYKYAENIKVPKDAIAVIVKFYNSYEDDIETQPNTNLKYKVEKIL